MAIDYTLNWTDDNLKSPFILSGGKTDIVATSLALTGKGTINWGERLQENLLHLLENFASNNVAPANATLGQEWFNASTKRLNVLTIAGWKELAYRRIDGPAAPEGPNYPGDLWYDTTTDLLKVYTNAGNWAWFGSGTGSPTGGGIGGGSTPDSGFTSYVPSFSPFTGPINVTRSQVIGSSSTDHAGQLANGSYYVFSAIAAGTSLPPSLSGYVNYLNNTFGQIHVKYGSTERWNDAGTAIISTHAVGLSAAVAAPGTYISLFSESLDVSGYVYKYQLSVSYTAAAGYTFIQTFRVAGGTTNVYTNQVPADPITIYGVVQYMKSNASVSAMPTITQFSFM